MLGIKAPIRDQTDRVNETVLPAAPISPCDDLAFVGHTFDGCNRCDNGRFEYW